MAAAINGDIYLVSVAGTIHAQKTITTFHYRLGNAIVPNGTTNDAYQVLHTAFEDPLGIAAGMKACATSSWRLDTISVQRVSPQRLVRDTRTVAAGNGTRATSTVTNIAGSITRRGEVATRRSVGRIQLVVGPGDETAGVMTGAWLIDADILAQRMTNIIDGSLTVGMFFPVIWTPPSGTPPISTNIDIYQCFAQSTGRCMRRRTVGLGK